MSTRKVVKYTEDLTSGKRIEQVVEKTDQAMRNTVTIQLFNEKGDKTTEAYTENAICSMYDAYAYQSIFNRLYAANNALQLPQYDAALGALRCSMPGMFSNIILCSGAEEEMSNPYAIQSPLVGYCGVSDTSGTGTSSTKGIFNASESYSELDETTKQMHVHRVYDWPTSAGNGKIQNIYWANRASTGYDGFGPYKETNKDNVGFDTFWRYDRHGNAYVIRSNKAYKITNLMNALFLCRPVETELDSTLLYSSELNGYYYTVSLVTSGTSGSSSFNMQMKVTKLDFSGNVVDVWLEELISPIPFLKELQQAGKLGTYSSYCHVYGGFLDDDGWMAVNVAYTNTNITSPYYCFPRVGKGDVILQNNASSYAVCYTMYNVLSKRWLYLPDPSKYVPLNNTWLQSGSAPTISDHLDTFIEKMSSGYSIAYGRSAYMYRIEGSEIKTYGSAAGTSRHPTIPVTNTNYGNSHTMYNVGYLIPIGAQTKLASPITKTSLNTMKIQYDFFYKIPILWWDKDHLWDLYK